MILLLGATGLLGSQILRRLIERQYPVRLLSRGSSDWKDAFIGDLRRRGIEVILADVNDENVLAQAVEGVTAIINLVGTLRLAADVDYQAMHVEAVQRMIENAQANNVQRFLQISCLGATPDNECEYFRTKWEAEQLVMDGDFHWTIFRPSYMFGDRFPLLDLLMPLIKFKPFLPILGSGLNQIQPVWVEDVAECVVKSIYERTTSSQVYDLAGPETLSMGEFMERARQTLGLSKTSFNIPINQAEKVLSILAKTLPKKIVNADLAFLLTSESSTEESSFEKFEMEALPLDDKWDDIMAYYSMSKADRHG